MIKKIISYLLSMSIILAMLPCRVIAASKIYNIDDTLAYAVNHWNDGNWQCAEFVSDCLTAGGVSVILL